MAPSLAVMGVGRGGEGWGWGGVGVLCWEYLDCMFLFMESYFVRCSPYCYY